MRTESSLSFIPQMNLAKWLYRGGRPNWMASILNRCWATIHSLGVAPNYLITLEVRGRRSRRLISLPLAMVVIEGERYLVSMLGAEADWVRNVKAAGDDVTIHHGRREEVRLEEIAEDLRAPVLKAYLKRAPGARAHFPIQKDASLSEFEQVSAQFPVFRVVPRSAGLMSTEQSLPPEARKDAPVKASVQSQRQRIDVVGRSIRASQTERTRTLPGDDIIANPIGSITDAITIRRPPHDVWPWLVQMGAGRAGWYSYDFIDNGRRPSSDRILPEFQMIAIGALLPAVLRATDAFVVTAYEAGRSLLLSWKPEPNGVPITTWSFVLEEPEPGCTRLIERGRVRSPYRPYGLPEWLAKRLAQLAHAVMVRKHLLGIAQRAETRALSPPNQLLQPTVPAIARSESSQIT
jgi:hypothetical protein